MYEPEVSFVIPTLNEADYITGCLESIKKQDVSKEIIIVDGGSRDKTLEKCSEDADKIIKNVDGRGKARDKGAKKANGKYIAFIDADTTLSQKYCREMIKFVQQNDLVAASSNFKITGIRSQLTRYITKELLLNRENPYLVGFNIFIPQKAYKKSVGFQNVPNEDLQFSKKISQKGEVGVLKEPLVTSSGRRVKKYGLTGVLIYYSYKESKRKIMNSKNSFERLEIAKKPLPNV